MVFRLTLLLCAISAINGIGHAQQKSHPSPYLFVWAADEDGKESDFLAVLDARPGSRRYGEVIATIPTGVSGTFPHHTEYEFPAGSMLFANGWGAGQTFIFNLKDPRKPKLAGEFKDVGDYSFPHSFARLPNGHVLTTLQVKKDGYEPPGALAELDPKGKLIRSGRADVAGMDKKQLWPYSLIALPQIDRVVSTATEMGLPKWAMAGPHGSTHQEHTLSDTEHVQIWRLSDLSLQATIPLPAVPGKKYHLNPAEPRLLPDGSLYINTFSCGLYRILGLNGSQPKAEFVYAFPGAGTKEECGVPVVVGKYWVQTDPSLPGLIVLDVSDPAKPVEVSRLVFDARFSKSHWVAADRRSHRLVVTGNHRSWVLIVNIDPNTGKLTLDKNWKLKNTGGPGIDFDRSVWPHGSSGKAIVHGALFGPVSD
jgi:hypothetical protein